MRTIACALLFLLATCAVAWADLCPKCTGQTYTDDVGVCKACRGMTSSGAFQLCRECSKPLGQCQRCRAPLAAGSPVELPKDKAARVAALSARLAEQRRTIWGLPDNAKLLRANEELNQFCSASDLVAVTWHSDHELCRAAFGLLAGSRGAELSAQDVANLLKHFDGQGTPQAWKVLWASPAIRANAAFGVPALTEAMRKDRRPFARVHAAAGLAANDARTVVSPDVRRSATMVLLEALGSEDEEVAGTAHNGLPRLEPWMVEWLLDRLSEPGASPLLWRNGLSRLAGGELQGLEKRVHRVCELGLGHPWAAVRARAMDVLRSLKLEESDKALCTGVQKDPDGGVRSRLYLALRESKAGWTAPLLMAGLDDGFAENAGICAQGLAQLRHHAAIPRLIVMLRRCGPIRSHSFDAGRQAAKAIVALAGLQGYDFNIRTRPVGNRHIHYDVIENRGDHYQKEAARLLEWWQREGKGKYGEGDK